MSWSRQRKTAYGLGTFFIVACVIVFPAYYFFYTPPTCSDGVQNQGEQGIDCGGPCRRLCPNAFMSPSISWTGVERVSPGLYNVAAYIINPNPTVGAYRVPYHAVLYDAKGEIIDQYYDVVSLHPHRNTLAFKGAVNTGARIPTRVLFEFTATPNWYAENDVLAALQVAKQDYSEDDSGAALVVTLHNSSPEPIGHTTVYAILYDVDGNHLGFSKTVVDGVPANGSALAPFTWPESWNGKVISKEILPVAE